MTRWSALLGVIALALGLSLGCNKDNDVTGTGTPEPDGNDAPVADSLAISRAFAPLLADGLDSVELMAVVIDDQGVGMPQVGVHFRTTLGTIVPFATTNAEGIAVTHLTSAASVENRNATVTAELTQKGTTQARSDGFVFVGRMRPSKRVIFDAMHISQARSQTGTSGMSVMTTAAATLFDTATVPMLGLTLSLRTETDPVPADGASQTRVIASLIQTERRIPVPNAEILFGATDGTVTGLATTDLSGTAIAVFTASTRQVPSIVTGYRGGLKSDTLVRQVAPSTAASVELTTIPGSMPADGTSEATLRAIVLDADGNAMPDGTPVTFSVESGGGTIVGTAQVTSEGSASATYVAGTDAGEVLVRATSSSASDEATLLLLAASEPAGITLQSVKPEILADGLASTTLNATLVDRFGHAIGAGVPVEFTTSRGTIDEVVPTDANGYASARLRATRFETGLARVTARVGEVEATTDLRFVSEGAAHLIPASVDRRHIGVLGAGDVETSSITYVALDRNGIPIDDQHAITVAFQALPAGGATDATLFPLQAFTTSHGEVRTTVNAGLISGAIEVRASSGSIETEPIRIVIHGGLPDAAHFSLSFERLNIAGLVYDGLRDGITARIADVHGNPVPDSTAVWFKTAFGIIQGSAQTNEFGEATVQHISAGPHPNIPGSDGLVTICARTVSRADQQIETCGDLLWSGPTIVEVTEPSTFDVPNGGSVGISFRVRDANDNPLTGGTTITVRSSAGEIAGDINLVLPDTQSRDYTFFRCVLSDEAPDENLARSVTVSIEVESQNGNRATSITGTMR